MKYIVIVADGIADFKLKELNNKTPLEYADTPNLSKIVKESELGIVRTIPPNFEPGSDVANLTILGVDCKKYYPGRAALEALSQNIPLKKNETVYRANLVTIENYIMKDYAAGHISTKEAKKIMDYLNKNFDSNIRFYPGVSYRNFMVHKNGLFEKNLIPPHNITGKDIRKYLPKGECLNIMLKSKGLLEKYKTKANMIWLWGPGKKASLKKIKIKGGIISGVDLINGIGKALGMEIIKVPGITEYYDTNYKNQAIYGIKSLERNDFVFIHIEAGDEAGHEGNIKEKIKAIENIDKLILGIIIEKMDKHKFKLLFLPDHYTPISLKKHTSHAVPFLIYPSKKYNNFEKFSEQTARKTKLYFNYGHQLIKFFLTC